MRICKYCGSLIEGEPVMNPDKYGNGYHHFCLVDKEFRERDKSIFQKGYDKGKADVLGEIWAEIEPKCDRINSLASVLPYTAHREIQELLCEIMALCKAEGGTQHETDS